MDFQQLAQELNNYCLSLSNQVAAIYALSESKDSNVCVTELDTSGLAAVNKALNNTEFINVACRSLDFDYQYDQCTKGAFSLSNELLGLKNAVNHYNNAHLKTTLYMVSNDCKVLQLYMQNLL